MEFNPFSKALQDDPYPVYRWLREESPLDYNEKLDLWTLSRYADVKEVLRDWKRFSNREGADVDKNDHLLAPGGLDETDEPDHDVMRKLVQFWFSPKSIRMRLEEPMRGEVRRILGQLREHDECNVAEELAWKLPTLVIAEMFDISHDERPYILSLMQPVFRRLPDDPVPPPEAIQAGQQIGEYLLSKIKERRGRDLDGREDLISVLVQSEIDGKPLTDSQILGNLAFLLVASSGTTQDAMSNLLYLLAVHPDERQKLVDDPSLIPDAVEEVLRFESPVQSACRLVLEDVPMHGGVLPEGARVVNLLGAANRDADYWDDSEVFNVTRSTKRSMVLGDGIHHCLGAPIARFETRIVAEEVLQAMPDYELTREPVRTIQHIGRGFEELYIRPNVAALAGG